MKPELKDNLLNKVWVGEQLAKARARHGFGSVKAAQDSIKGQPGPALSGLLRNEKGEAFPGWDTLVILANACKISLSELVAEIEGETSVSESGVEIVKSKAHLYRMLTTILKEENDRRELGITVNLEDISAASLEAMEARDEPTKEEVGNISARVRKKQRQAG